ncbi:hypothetical protein [uncultured Cardiobacterium sp.]|uniref:hypothetical protein n=1 Tax=uncultured Cardiobacterium sp. TaxID=417619 RepID=UPI0026288928|nr:hypothetical protein [uncultured Cardiobacterium sp.]
MIKESVKAHGKHQLEIKQKVLFDRHAKEIRYRIDTWFFLPSALQINPDFYATSDFRRSLKNYVRLRPPTEKIAHLSEAGGALDTLAAWLTTAQRDPALTLDDYENTLKRYALTYKRALRLAVKLIEKNPQKRNETTVRATLAAIRAALAAYRALAAQTAPLETALHSAAFRYCDEYLTLMTVYYLRRLAAPADVPARAAIRALWRDETAYCRNHYPASMPEAAGNNEEVLYRWSALKKYINRYLYLDVRRKKGNPLLMHTVYAVAAAIAMIFATFVAFFWQGKYGALSSNLFMAVVIAYIFKDRMKDIGREQLLRLFRKWIPDRRLVIYRGEKTIVGGCRENYRFVEHDLLPPDIAALRERGHWLQLLNDQRDEDILLYKKDVTLHNRPALFERTQYSIVDIIRFNIADFLKQIDNLFEPLPLPEDENGDSRGERIYHIYMIRRIDYAGQQASELVRLVVNAAGIKRLEMIQPLQFAAAATADTDGGTGE